MTPSEGIETRKAKILLVDDEVVFTTNMSKILSRRGYVVVAVNDGKSALEAIDEHEFDVVILDMKMPGMDGMTALREIKRRWPCVEVIILTGHGSVESGIQGMQLGAFDYAMKPIMINELQEKISEAFERKLIQEERLRMKEE
jgi:two-component system, OmpR family, response regulator